MTRSPDMRQTILVHYDKVCLYKTRPQRGIMTRLPCIRQTTLGHYDKASLYQTYSTQPLGQGLPCIRRATRRHQGSPVQDGPHEYYAGVSLTTLGHYHKVSLHKVRLITHMHYLPVQYRPRMSITPGSPVQYLSLIHISEPTRRS